MKLDERHDCYTQMLDIKYGQVKKVDYSTLASFCAYLHDAISGHDELIKNFHEDFDYVIRFCELELDYSAYNYDYVDDINPDLYEKMSQYDIKNFGITTKKLLESLIKCADIVNMELKKQSKNSNKKLDKMQQKISLIVACYVTYSHKFFRDYKKELFNACEGMSYVSATSHKYPMAIKNVAISIKNKLKDIDNLTNSVEQLLISMQKSVDIKTLKDNNKQESENASIFS